MNCYTCKDISSKCCGKMEYIQISSAAGYWRKRPDERCKEPEKDTCKTADNVL